MRRRRQEGSGPREGPIRPERTRAAHPPALDSARSTGHMRSEGPSPPVPVRMPAPGALRGRPRQPARSGSWDLTRVPVSSLSLCPARAPWSSGGHCRCPSHSLDGLRHRVHGTLHGRPREQPVWLRGRFRGPARGEAAQRVRPPPPSADSPRPPPLPPCSCHFRPSSLPEPRIRSRSPGSSLLLIGSGYLGALGGRPWPCLGKMEGRF